MCVRMYVSKFRPISLLNIGGKVLEKVLINRINHHVFSHDLMNSMCIYIYIYMYVGMYVYMYVRKYVFVNVCTYVCMCVCMYVRTYICMYVRTYVCMCVYV